MASNFPYKRIVLTGATSGIGRALLDRIIQSSSSTHVIAVGRNEAELQKILGEYGSKRITVEPFDISDLAALPNWVEKLTTKFPDIDAVILNAGFQHMPDIAGKPESVDLGRIKDELETNYLSPVNTTVLMLPHFKKLKQQAAIIFVSSGLGITPSIECPTYSASKAAIHSFVWTLRSNLAEESSHIQVIEIIPPAVKTELHTRQGLSQKGMELTDFLEEAWAGLESGKDEIPVGPVKERYSRAEGERRKMFEEMADMMRQQQKK